MNRDLTKIQKALRVLVRETLNETENSIDKEYIEFTFSLAGKPISKWTQKMASRAYYTVVNHKENLAKAGLEISEIGRPNLYLRNGYVRNGFVTISFNYDSDIINDIKNSVSSHFRFFDPETKEWSIVREGFHEILPVLKKHDFPVYKDVELEIEMDEVGVP